MYCCCPAASTSVERLWSAAGHLVTRRRSRMSPELLCEVLFLKQNSNIAKKCEEKHSGQSIGLHNT